MIATTKSWNSLLSLLLMLFMTLETSESGVIDPLPERGTEPTKSSLGASPWWACFAVTEELPSNIRGTMRGSPPTWQAVAYDELNQPCRDMPSDKRPTGTGTDTMAALRPMRGVEEIERFERERLALRTIST
jgi:hypothetical protein